ncbi:NAD(P)-binding protein [Hyaloscypha variabilis F]|uniref:NAD(P)-binding protein n=1 Tax=Hyaloscypha variabilis (strain UAMH 11265 / GT02V1 / F) TaxID=1149755 RepID=A0A2J6S9I5_HYAVF|nr:NAD(P)-binding protein [Hyaloscypha variabilis F]
MFQSGGFNPDTDILDLSGKVIFITGGTGLGKETATQLAKHSPSAIYITARDTQKGDIAAADIRNAVPSANITVLQMDLASLKSVQTAAKQFLASSSRLDILFNNAGVMAVPAGLTKDGYEIQIGTNHLGHALLTKLLMPTLLKTAQLPNTDVRIVTVSAIAYAQAPKGGIKFDLLRTTQEENNKIVRYCQSKLANILYSNELASRYPSITAVSLHPGVVETNLSKPLQDSHRLARLLVAISKLIMVVSVQKGALNQLWAATSKEVQTGEFYVPVGKKDESNVLKDTDLAKKLWDWTETELQSYNM